MCVQTEEVFIRMKNWINRFHARLDAWGEKLCEKEIRIPVDLTVGILFFSLRWQSCSLCPSR